MTQSRIRVTVFPNTGSEPGKKNAWGWTLEESFSYRNPGSTVNKDEYLIYWKSMGMGTAGWADTIEEAREKAETCAKNIIKKRKEKEQKENFVKENTQHFYINDET